MLPTLATQIGLNEALFLQQLHYWLKRSKHEHDESKWIYNTFEDWRKQFPFWSLRTMQRIAKSLLDRGLIRIHKYSSKEWDQKNWYAINYEVLEKMSTEMQHAKLAVSQPSEWRDLDHAKMAVSSTENTQESTSLAHAREFDPKRSGTLANRTKPERSPRPPKRAKVTEATLPIPDQIKGDKDLQDFASRYGFEGDELRDCVEKWRLKRRRDQVLYRDEAHILDDLKYWITTCASIRDKNKHKGDDDE